jgi:hypothetical protein
MLSRTDLIQLTYTPDLTPAGIAYACQTLPHPSYLKTSQTFRYLRHMIAQQAAELAFRRLLTSRQVPYRLSCDLQFVRPERLCAVIGGRRCSLYTSTFLKKEKVRWIHQDLSRLLSIPAVIPSVDLNQENHCPTDLLVFSFVTGLVTPTRSELRKAISAGNPVRLIYPLPPAWSKPFNAGQVGRIVLKSGLEQKISLILGGYTKNYNYTEEEVDLPPLVAVQTVENYLSLAFLQLTELPTNHLGLHSPGIKKTLVVRPYQWGNIWIYGMGIVLTGWMTRAEFRSRAYACHPDPTSIPPASSDGRYLAVQVAHLHPLENLFNRAQSWR